MYISFGGIGLDFIGVVCCLLLYLVPHNGVKHCEGCNLHYKRKRLECPCSQRRGDYPSRGIDSQALLLRGFLAVVSCSWLEEGLEFGEGRFPPFKKSEAVVRAGSRRAFTVKPACL